MNEDRITGAGKELLGKAERTIGTAIGSDGLASGGAVDQISGALQHGYGELRDGVTTAIDSAPDLLSDALEGGRRMARQTDDYLRDTFGDARPIYVLAGAVTALAVAVLWAGRER